MTRIIGITGGIATGKSLVCERLKDAHLARVISCDAIGIYLMETDTTVIKDLKAMYPPCFNTANGSINRKILSGFIFDSEENRLKVNEIFHRRIFNIVERNIEMAKEFKTRLVIEIPLLFESKHNWRGLLTEIWVVASDREAQMHTLMKNRGNSKPQAEMKINAQMPIEEKIGLADVVFENYVNTSKSALYKAVEAAWELTDERVAQVIAQGGRRVYHCNELFTDYG